jgi:allantoin racemase
MADLTPQITEAVGLPIVEGVTAAIKLAEALVGLGLGTSKYGDLAFPLAKPFVGRFKSYSNLTSE